jgi:hypothetical protein
MSSSVVCVGLGAIKTLFYPLLPCLLHQTPSSKTKSAVAKLTERRNTVQHASKPRKSRHDDDLETNRRCTSTRMVYKTLKYSSPTTFSFSLQHLLSTPPSFSANQYTSASSLPLSLSFKKKEHRDSTRMTSSAPKSYYHAIWFLLLVGTPKQNSSMSST